jgi:hypothetical protein
MIQEKGKTKVNNLTRIHLLGRLLQTKTPSRAEGFDEGMATEKDIITTP